MQNKQKVVISAALVLAIGLGCFFGSGSQPESERGSAVSGEAAESPFRAGERHRYQLGLDTRVNAEGGQVLQYSLSGQWLVDVVSADARGARLLVSVANPELRSEMAAQDQKARLAEAQADFTKPILISLDARGLVIGVREQERMELQASTMMRSIAAVMQVAAPELTDASSWESTEQDSVGTYQARYERKGEQLHKTKLRYTELAKHGNMNVASTGQLEMAESHGKIVLSKQGLVHDLSYDEATKISGGMLKGLTSKSTYRLAYLGSEPIPAQSPALQTPQLAAQVTVPPSERVRMGSYSVEADRARIAGRSFSDLMAEFDALPADEKNDTDGMRHQRRKAFIGLAALMRLNRTAVSDAQRAIQSGSRHARTLWDALASAGTPESQRALVDVIRMPSWKVGERRSQMIGLSMVESPTRDTVEFLKSMVSDPVQGQQARFGLGTAVQHLADENPSLAKEVLGELTHGLEQATTINEKVDILGALGNTAHGEARPAIDAYLTDEDAQLRAKAVWALRQQPGADVDSVLAKLMTGDPSSAVRAQAVQAAGTRNPSQALVDGVLAVLDGETDPRTKNAALFALRRYEGMEPALAQQLAQRTGP